MLLTDFHVHSDVSMDSRASMREMAEARRRLQAAEAAGKTGEELAACSNALKAAAKKIEKNRAESIALVNRQMRKSTDNGQQ